MTLTIRETSIELIDLKTRMPFKYGIATMTEMPLAFVRVSVEVDGTEHEGVSSDLLPPKWFTKIPEKPPLEEITEMLSVIQNALNLARELKGPSPFEIWHQLHSAQDAWGKKSNHPPLLTHFGTSLVERALIDATARALETPFHSLLSNDLLGIDLGRIHSDLKGLTPSQLLPSQPLPQVSARHTVGLADPLGDIDVEDALNDGLPQSLTDCIRTYGLKHFKLKVSGKFEEDRERLSQVARILEQEAPDDYAFTLDGNEQFQSFEAFQEFWSKLSSLPNLTSFLKRMRFIEQPLHRDAALKPEVESALGHWTSHPPFIIDESDGSLDSASTAIRLGYNGTSHKNCKGVFKGIVNRCLINKLNNDHPSSPFLMSGEDLCNVGPVALLQDLAVMAALGIESVERNGHHYNAGLSQLPAAVQQQTLKHHPDLYKASLQGWPTLDIRQGHLSMQSINDSPFGVGFIMPPIGSNNPSSQ